MEVWNRTVFLAINASDHPGRISLLMAISLANHVIWVVLGALVLAWLMGRPALRRGLVEACLSGLVGITVNILIGIFWEHPRPFMIGLGHTFIPHAPDSSFPSDHLTLLWSMAFSLLLHRRTRRAGTGLSLLGLPVAWARIYLGVHYPLDMAGSLGVAGFSAWVALGSRQAWMLEAWPAAECIRRVCLRMIPARRGHAGPVG